MYVGTHVCAPIRSPNIQLAFHRFGKITIRRNLGTKKTKTNKKYVKKPPHSNEMISIDVPAQAAVGITFTHALSEEKYHLIEKQNRFQVYCV